MDAQKTGQKLFLGKPTQKCDNSYGEHVFTIGRIGRSRSTNKKLPVQAGRNPDSALAPQQSRRIDASCTRAPPTFIVLQAPRRTPSRETPFLTEGGAAQGLPPCPPQNKCPSHLADVTELLEVWPPSRGEPPRRDDCRRGSLEAQLPQHSWEQV